MSVISLILELKDNASGPLQNIREGLSGVSSIATGLATGGIFALGSGLAAAVTSGLSFNNSMEQVTAQLNAFTKDGAKTADILGMIKDRAASTPFEFEAMAQAATALLPASKASGVALEDLIAQAEVLAASNPAEGLEGAAFALKEALSGDFLSLVERFNLPKQRLNELKEQGVPAIEAVQIAMQELGLDADLVTGLAGTASGRWSTFMDTLTNVAATITGPLFTAFSSGLAGVQGILDQNTAGIAAFAESLAGNVSNAINAITTQAIPALINGWNSVQPAIATVIDVFNQVQPVIAPVVAMIASNLQPILLAVAAVLAGSLVAAIASAVAAFLTVAAPIMAMVALGALLVEAWNSNFGGIRDLVTQVMSNVRTTIDTVLGAIRGFWTAHGAQVTAVVRVLAEFLATSFRNGMQIIAGVVNTVLAVIRGDWTAAGEGIKQIASGLFSQLRNTFDTGFTLLKTVTTTARDNLVELIKALPDKVANVGAAIVSMIREGFETAWSNFLSWVNDQLEKFRDKLPFSEPRDTSSPLYGLGKSGASIVGMIQAGIDRAGGLTVPGAEVGAPNFAGAAGAAGAAAIRTPVTDRFEIDLRVTASGVTAGDRAAIAAIQQAARDAAEQVIERYVRQGGRLARNNQG